MAMLSCTYEHVQCAGCMLHIPPGMLTRPAGHEAEARKSEAEAEAEA